MGRVAAASRGRRPDALSRAGMSVIKSQAFVALAAAEAKSKYAADLNLASTAQFEEASALPKTAALCNNRSVHQVAAQVTESPPIQLEGGYTFLKVKVHRNGARLGIGLDDAYCITQLVPEGPGDQAGLRVNDQLMEVCGISVSASNAPIASLMPQEGVPLILGVRRPPDEPEVKPLPEEVETWASGLSREFSAPTNVVLRRLETSVDFGIEIEYTEKGHGLPEIVALHEGGLALTTVQPRSCVLHSAQSSSFPMRVRASPFSTPLIPHVCTRVATTFVPGQYLLVVPPPSIAKRCRSHEPRALFHRDCSTKVISSSP